MAAPSYSFATIPGSTTPATDILTAIEVALADAGWQFVEEYAFTQTATARLQRTWLCPGTLNHVGTDFYVHLVRNAAGTGYVSVRSSEGYDVAAHRLLRPTFGNTSNASYPMKSDGSGIPSADQAYNPDGTTVSPPFAENSYGSLSTNTSYDLNLLVSRSYITFTLTPASNYSPIWGCWTGYFDEPLQGQDFAVHPPLVMLPGNQAALNVAGAGMSRAPMLAYAANSAFYAGMFLETWTWGLIQSNAAFTPPGGHPIRVTRPLVGGNGSAQFLSYTNIGAPYGVLPDSILVPDAGTNHFRPGDRLVVAGKTWTKFLNKAFAMSPGTANGLVADSISLYVDVTAGT